MDEQKREIYLTVDPTGGCLRLCGQIIVGLVIVVVAFVVIDGALDLLRRYWWVLALAGAGGLVLWAIYSAQMAGNEERIRASTAQWEAQQRALRESSERSEREWNERITRHQARMRDDIEYRNKCMAIARRDLVAMKLDLDPDNPYLEENSSVIEDTLVWEQAYLFPLLEDD